MIDDVSIVIDVLYPSFLIELDLIDSECDISYLITFMSER